MAIDPAVIRFNKDLQKAIGGLEKKGLERAVKRALKRTEPSVTKYISKRIREEFKPTGFSPRKDLKVRSTVKDRKGNFFSGVIFRRETFSMGRYRPSLVNVGKTTRKVRRVVGGKKQSKNRTIKSVRVKIGSNTFILPNSFIIRKGKTKLPFVRYKKGKQGIRLIAGPGPAALVKRKEERRALKKIATERFNQELTKAVQFGSSRGR